MKINHDSENNYKLLLKEIGIYDGFVAERKNDINYVKKIIIIIQPITLMVK